MQQECKNDLKDLFQYKFEHLESGFKYLGFYIKPNIYGVKDWQCIIKNIDKRISKDFKLVIQISNSWE